MCDRYGVGVFHRAKRSAGGGALWSCGIRPRIGDIGDCRRTYSAAAEAPAQQQLGRRGSFDALAAAEAL